MRGGDKTRTGEEWTRLDQSGGMRSEREVNRCEKGEQAEERDQGGTAADDWPAATRVRRKQTTEVERT